MIADAERAPQKAPFPLTPLAGYEGSITRRGRGGSLNRHAERNLTHPV